MRNTLKPGDQVVFRNIDDWVGWFRDEYNGTGKRLTALRISFGDTVTWDYARPGSTINVTTTDYKRYMNSKIFLVGGCMMQENEDDIQDS